MKEIVPVVQFFPQERVSDSVIVQIVDVPVPQDLDEIVELGRLTRARVNCRVKFGGACSTDYGENVEPQPSSERVLERIGERIDDEPVPQNLKEIIQLVSLTSAWQTVEQSWMCLFHSL